MNQRFGRMLGRLVYPLAKKDRGIADYQLGFCFPDKPKHERQAIVKGVFKNVGMTVFETLSVSKVRKEMDTWIQLHNVEVIRAAEKGGKGAVILVAHIANWELFTVVFEKLNIHGKAIHRARSDKKLGELLDRNRTSTHLKMIARQERSSAKEMLSCFRNNEFLIIAIDQDTQAKSVFVDFFGKKAATPIGAAGFAQKFDAPVISAYSYRDADGRHHFHFQTLSEAPYKGGEVEKTQLTQKYTTALETHIRNYPSQWVWFHRRWKNQPDGE